MLVVTSIKLRSSENENEVIPKLLYQLIMEYWVKMEEVMACGIAKASNK